MGMSRSEARCAAASLRRPGAADIGPVQNLAIEMVELAPVALLLVSGAGVVWLANQRAEVLLGRTAERLLGLAVTDVLGLPGWRLQWAGGGDGAAAVPGQVRRPDGSSVAVEVSATALPVPNGRWAILALQDRTHLGVPDGATVAGGKGSLSPIGRVPSLLDRVVGPLLEAAMAVQAAIGMVGPPAASCLMDAADEVDWAIRRLWDLAFPSDAGAPGTEGGDQDRAYGKYVRDHHVSAPAACGHGGKGRNVD